MSRSLAMSAPDLDPSDVAAVLEVLRSGRLALGRRAEAFEEELAAYVGAHHGVALSSGTAALHLIVEGLGLGPGDDVLVPSFTFAASVNALLYTGARPVFVDIESETFNLCPDELERRVTPRTRAVLVVDVFGHPAERDRIWRFADERGLSVIGDCCEALGAEYRGRPLGPLSHASAYGFYPNKQITCGEGGMLVTDDAALAVRARSLRNQGRESMGAIPCHERLGYNYRMDEMSAALGRSQLQRIESLLERRRAVAELYTERLRGIPWLRTPVVRAEVRMSWFVYVVTLAADRDRQALVESLAAEGVPSRAYFPPVHLQPYIRERLGTREGDLPRTESIASRTLALPFHSGMGPDAVERVVAALHRAEERALARG